MLILSSNYHADYKNSDKLFLIHLNKLPIKFQTNVMLKHLLKIVVMLKIGTTAYQTLQVSAIQSQISLSHHCNNKAITGAIYYVYYSTITTKPALFYSTMVYNHHGTKPFKR